MCCNVPASVQLRLVTWAANLISAHHLGKLSWGEGATVCLLCRDPVAALVLCTPSIGFVDLSIINGEIIVREGKFTTIELQVRP